MANSPRPLTNDYRDCTLIKLDPGTDSSPLFVAQEGYAPGDATFQMRMYFLQRDGIWIDEIARSTRPDEEIPHVVFETAAEVVEVFARLDGPPAVRDIPLTPADIENYRSRVSSGSSVELLRGFLARYRASRQPR